ncbi:hypothetical protein LTR47_000346 [Exophiala xenobiotica]|nr:hypothetical protein LTR72_002211 [Exophiala xenobiotica]KAK5238603.1 hypothetical protein LTR47_000346 [Exophiala xenobiotica]KAK5243112.1 hypothetical protein LTS06_011051 [Exophiala xenobiotica]KAK5302237.1 hypothetical protein LTR14_000486 [Exophiala xenobiotica]KAK5325484.1 hypothetical protein LTR93_003704 [Exophiala xenobiotica]
MNGEQSVVAPFGFARVTKQDEVVRFAQVLCSAFSNDPLNRYLFLGRESRPDHPKLLADAHDGDRLEYWLPGILKRFKNGEVLVQSSNWAAVALWILPTGIEKPAPAAPQTTTTTSTASEGVDEYTTTVDHLKEKYLGEDRLHWTLHLIGRAPDRPDKGAVRALVSPFLDRARAEKVPVWLEATNEHARDVYAHLGFTVVEEFRIGKGVVNSEGWVQENGEGEGVLIYAMILGLEEDSGNATTFTA